MANAVASLKLILTYPAPGGGTVVVPQIAISAPFKASAVGFVDIPDGDDDGAEYEIPFGSVDDGATMAIIHNQSGQALELKINGGTVDQEIANGGVAVVAAADLPDGIPLTALSVLATALQAGTGQVGFFVFGDPEPVP